MVTVSSVLTVEGTGGLLTEPASGGLGTVTGAWLDTGASMETGRMTDGLLTGWSSVAGLAPADTRSHTVTSQTTARNTLGSLTVASSPASLGDRERAQNIYQTAGRSCQVRSCYVMSCHVMSCYVMSCHVILCYVIMSYQVMSCHIILYYMSVVLSSCLADTVIWRDRRTPF